MPHNLVSTRHTILIRIPNTVVTLHRPHILSMRLLNAIALFIFVNLSISGAANHTLILHRWTEQSCGDGPFDILTKLHVLPILCYYLCYRLQNYKQDSVPPRCVTYALSSVDLSIYFSICCLHWNPQTWATRLIFALCNRQEETMLRYSHEVCRR